ncbi:Alpha-methylacyl-CoA racemase [Pseudonocardia sp. Ae168_Ps1]|uniref:CaiB/BaiF CoA transferase family protein n=1 Tax=unclassified Pseudonocardia TaxID=2619320 RepID=UPI00096550AA|nr:MULTISPECIES: CaiB/BaiF CoA-transferase family protein [unclassified Pseudonocardia]OLL73438.1 Alpha-methylacyl-CoA racemase [Pseudonocardia sp. Ae150A_Ps1]OLL79415.1 Alpha-methylacyl-CoA racemase [Pseudonocardia sp. Ae168_Ps1]OLL86451.1 Alpha-methylacyl-CoA racemase [Pseudonocardia sp. Ae263_Ps1]OLL93508.1 Alpha-methylacyl-CoA racemase [Pseudonocardia sp. Ae356_Ps1]
MSGGPLAGLKVIELAGIGPGPYAAMLLADMGADVLRIDRPGSGGSAVPAAQDVLRRGRRSAVLDLRDERGVRAVLDLVSSADVLIEGFRPGGTERMGLGPDDCWAVNPALVYGRMTGWGQDGPLARTAGHDIGYIALTGALHAIGRADQPPTPPLNLVGDFGGGATFLVMGVLAALWEARGSGRGQVVDAAIVDGAASLTGLLHGMLAAGLWRDRPASNMLDTGMPWYDVYPAKDGGHLAVGALEPAFFAQFVDVLGIEADESDRRDPSRWPALRERIAEAFAARDRDEWAAEFAATDACVAPVLGLTEAAKPPHLKARETFVEIGGIEQPAPAPRFSRTASEVPDAPVEPGTHTRQALAEWGITTVDELIEAGVAQQH